jgi:hypothetical protein
LSEQAYLAALRASSMRLYEIEGSRPGESLNLRDIVEGDRVTVQERLGSKSLDRFDWIAARVLAAGASGKPEIEGILQVPPLLHQRVRDRLRATRDRYFRDRPGATVDAFYKTTTPFFHGVWAGAILEPSVPRLANTDGEEMVITRVVFDVLDREHLVEALDRAEGIERDEGEREMWRWSGKNLKGEAVSLGLLRLGDQSLSLEANSVARGERGRAMVESAAGAALRHRGTTHEDMQRSVGERLRSGDNGAEPDGGSEIPPEIQEALVLDHQARHYRRWLDEPVPALDDRTPRAAAKDAALRPRLVELLHDLGRMYQRSLKLGHPAFDPSWMWDALGLGKEPPSHPPPLAHERIAQLVPGSGEVCRAVAEALRRRPGFDDRSTVLGEEVVHTNLELQRLLRERQAARVGRLPEGSQGLDSYLLPMLNFELHRRKSFWVDESLAYMLARTDLDVRGDELRVPFPSFAMVFTDRHVLSLAERLLARQRGCPLAGQFLHVATVFVTEHHGTGEERTLRLCFALDALGADPPYLVVQEIPLHGLQQVESHLDRLAPAPQVEPAVPNANPLRGLLHVSINAILYATSAGVEPHLRRAPAQKTGQPRPGHDPPVTYSSDEVFFLPGAIEISRIRGMQELERIPEGRTILRRFMVRGHWRRPAGNWTDQRMRWIAPHWKGPSMATIIERTYKLKP